MGIALWRVYVGNKGPLETQEGEIVPSLLF